MDKDKRNRILLGAALLAVLLVWIRGLTMPIRPREGLTQASFSPSGAPSGTISPGRALPAASHERDFSKMRARTQFSDWGRDPFLPEGRLAQGAKGLILNGIVWDETTPLAMINDQVLGVGSRIGNSRITKITQTEVFLEEGNEIFTLRLLSESP